MLLNYVLFTKNIITCNNENQTLQKNFKVVKYALININIPTTTEKTIQKPDYDNYILTMHPKRLSLFPSERTP